MSGHVRYVRTRDGVFQYERRVPLRIQRDSARFAAAFGSKPLFRRSLRTKDTFSMFDAGRMVHEEFERLIAQAPVTEVTRHAPSIPARVITDHDLRDITNHYATVTSSTFETLHRRANVDPLAEEELERVQYDLERDAEEITRALRTRHGTDDALPLSPSREAAHLVSERGYVAPDGSEALGAIISAVRVGIEQGFERMYALANGQISAAIPTVGTSMASRCTMTLADAVRQYLEGHKPPSKIAAETKLALRQFEEVIGRKALAATSRDDVHTFAANLARRKVGGKSAGSVARNLSEQTISKRLRMLSTAVTYVRDRSLFGGDNMMTGVKVAALVKSSDRAAMPEKRRFQTQELRRIFTHPWFTGCKSLTDTHSPGEIQLDGVEYWVPVVAAYTGCRASELGGLKLSEVRLDHPCPHFIIRNNEYRNTKNTRQRAVPVLDALIALGFPAYVDRIRRSGADRLFPDWEARTPRGGCNQEFPAWANGKVIRAFNRTVVPMALGDTMQDNTRREVTFHGFRGAFKSMLGTTYNLPINVVNEIIGHAKTELDTRYIGVLSIEETYPLARSCQYPNLQVPSRCVIEL